MANEFLLGELPEGNNPVVVSDKVRGIFGVGATRDEIEVVLKNYGFEYLEREMFEPNSSCMQCDSLYIDGRIGLRAGWGREIFWPKYSLVVTIGFKDGRSNFIEGWVVKNLY